MGGYRTIGPAVIEWSAAGLALPGQSDSGDRHLVMPIRDGVLVAVIDGLGHGDEAAAAAKVAVATLERNGHEPVITMMTRCHESLRGTRGAVITLAAFNGLDGTMTWVGVGNVEGMLFRADPTALPVYESLLLRGGVLGGQLPLMSASIVPVMPGDTLILATDGIRSRFAQGLRLNESPKQIADRILAQHAKGTDDALVLVARYLGGGA
jgi:serine/threonine protein phosphatase PrpC